MGRIPIYSKWEQVAGGWRKLHNEELHNLHASCNIIRVIKLKRIKWAKHVTLMGEVRIAYKILIGKCEGKRPLGRPRCRWEDSITVDLVDIGWEVVDWIHLTEHRD
jgi:hypothetical protein